MYAQAKRCAKACTYTPTHTYIQRLHTSTAKQTLTSVAATQSLLLLLHPSTSPLTLPHSWGCGRGSPCQPGAAPLPSPSPAFAPGPPSGTPAGRAAPRPTGRDTDREEEEGVGGGGEGRRQDGLVPLLGFGCKKRPHRDVKGPCCLLAAPCARCRGSCGAAEASRLAAPPDCREEQRREQAQGLQCRC